MTDVFGGGALGDAVSAGIELAVQIEQYRLFEKGFKKYRKILKGLADEVEEDSLENFAAYETLRAKDKEFYEYFAGLPDYAVCEANVLRSKGAAWRKYADGMRRTNRATRGYTPLSMVQLGQTLGREPIHEIASRRTTTLIAERSRVDKHILGRWTAIVASSTNDATYVALDNAVRSLESTISGFASGMNASAVGIGTSLGKLDNAFGESKRSSDFDVGARATASTGLADGLPSTIGSTSGISSAAGL